ncbi:MAG: metal-dependent transcriptional regulator [Acidobacteriota bacterium]|nr:metal-dependent transcriptional regulator [Acidobacteriota bacterium]
MSTRKPSSAAARPRALSAAGEDCLKTLYARQAEGERVPVSTGRLAGWLRVSPSTATAMIQSLAAGGWLHYEPYRGARLSPRGRMAGARILRRHRLVEALLVEVLGLDWSEVHAEAERLEHALSDRLADRIEEVLGHPRFDPHGDPIPDRQGQTACLALRSLLECAEGERLVLLRVADQEPRFLEHLSRLGLRPGNHLHLLRHDEAADTVTLALGRRSPLSLGRRAAARLLVAREDEGAAGE